MERSDSIAKRQDSQLVYMEGVFENSLFLTNIHTSEAAKSIIVVKKSQSKQHAATERR